MVFDEVRALELFDGLADDRLQALVDASEEVAFSAGDLLWNEREPAVFWWVLLEGRLDMVRHVGRELVVMGSFTYPGQWGEGWAAFDPHGVYLVTGRATTAGRILRVPVQALRALGEDVPVIRHLLDGLFHTARQIETSTRQREALVSLGTLSAGLAHEINNPAAAAIRAAEALDSAIADSRLAARSLAAAGLTEDQYAALDALLARSREAKGPANALAVSDREDALSSWMLRHGVDRDWILAPALATTAVTPASCDEVLVAVGEADLQPALEWLASTLTLVALIGEVKESTQRVSDLVSSVKSYSQMDRGSLQRIDVTEGIESTLAVLAHRLTPRIEVVRAYGEPVPEIEAYAGDLNQVWTGLIDNAVDAMVGSGVLTVAVAAEGDDVIVTISDTGGGMPAEVLEHAFDPFFTTKEVGMGTGLGLANARRVVVERHGGDMSLSSSPRGTAVRVVLPTRQGVGSGQ
jgi:signal transduction histidine kinase